MERLIRTKASQFRTALDQVSSEIWEHCAVTAFPFGACGHCAELLARYLDEELGIKAMYASGDVNHLVDSKYHAWLEYDGLYIDISADQFGMPPVIVSRYSQLHAEADDVDRHPIYADQWWPQYAEPIWSEAKRYLR